MAPLKRFVAQEADKSNLSLIQVVAGVGLSPSFFSELLSGKHSPSVRDRRFLWHYTNPPF
jgi:hypothetical protein